MASTLQATEGLSVASVDYSLCIADTRRVVESARATLSQHSREAGRQGRVNHNNLTIERQRGFAVERARQETRDKLLAVRHLSHPTPASPPVRERSADCSTGMTSSQHADLTNLTLPTTNNDRSLLGSAHGHTATHTPAKFTRRLPCEELSSDASDSGVRGRVAELELLYAAECDRTRCLQHALAQTQTPNRVWGGGGGVGGECQEGECGECGTAMKARRALEALPQLQRFAHAVYGVLELDSATPAHTAIQELRAVVAKARSHN